MATKHENDGCGCLTVLVVLFFVVPLGIMLWRHALG